MRKIATQKGVDLPEIYAVAMIFFFFSRDLEDINTFKEYCEINDLKVILTRTVPVDTDALGQQALDSLPNIVQVFVKIKYFNVIKKDLMQCFI